MKEIQTARDLYCHSFMISIRINDTYNQRHCLPDDPHTISMNAPNSITHSCQACHRHRLIEDDHDVRLTSIPIALVSLFNKYYQNIYGYLYMYMLIYYTKS